MTPTERDLMYTRREVGRLAFRGFVRAPSPAYRRAWADYALRVLWGLHDQGELDFEGWQELDELTLWARGLTA